MMSQDSKTEAAAHQQTLEQQPFSCLRTHQDLLGGSPSPASLCYGKRTPCILSQWRGAPQQQLRPVSMATCVFSLHA